MSSERYRLVMRSGPNPGKVFELSMDLMSIGREATNDIVIQDSEISRNHARISRRGGGFVLEDLGATNGTFINRQRITSPRTLAPGDELGFGENVVVVFQGEGAAATVAAPSARGQPRTQQPAPPPPPPPPAYYGGPAPAPRSGSNRGLLAGIIVLIVLCVLALICAFAFDYLNLYCSPPFDMLFGTLGYCSV